jgi:NAD(P)-dependent dehydrogenase (short-subunit alcohol dehydrogenase family)
MSYQTVKERRVAIVTGAANGIGKAIALRLFRDGFNLIVCDLGTQIHNLSGVVRELEGLAAMVQSNDGLGLARCEAMECDVTQEDQVQRMVDRAVELFGRLDCVRYHFKSFSMKLTSFTVSPLDGDIDGSKCGNLHSPISSGQ